MRPVLLDLDDTLMDDHRSTRVAFEAFVHAHRARLENQPFPALLARWRRALQQYWVQYERGELSFSEQRRMRIRTFLGDNLSDAEADHAFQPYLLAYEASWELLPGVSEFFEQSPNIPKVILTNGDREQQLQKVRRTGLQEHVLAVITPADCGSWKPRPEMFLAGAAVLGVSPRNCIMIGDHLVRDIEPASALGMLCFQVKPGQSREVFTHALAAA